MILELQQTDIGKCHKYEFNISKELYPVLQLTHNFVLFHKLHFRKNALNLFFLTDNISSDFRNDQVYSPINFNSVTFTK